MEYALIILVNVVLYWRIISYGLVCDDVMANLDAGPWPKNVFLLWWDTIVNLKLYDKRVSHIVSLSFHTITCLLIYIAFGRNDLSFLQAALFAVNVSNSECSIWISGKHYIYHAILILLMFVIPYSVIVIAPFLIFIYVKSIKIKLKQKDLTLEEKTFRPRKIILFFKTYGYYFWTCLIPVKMGYYHGVISGVGLTENYNKEAYRIDRRFWVGVGTVYLVVSNMIFNWNQSMMGIVWFSVCIIPFCNLFTISMPIAFRYSYHANVGLMYFLAMNIIAYPWLIGAVLAAYVVRLWDYMPAYQDEFWFSEYNIIEQPGFARNWMNRARKRFKAGDHTGALQDYLEAHNKCFHDCKINFNCASMYMVQGMIDDAEYHLDIAGVNIYQNTGGPTQVAMIKEMRENIAQARKTGQVELKKVVIMK